MSRTRALLTLNAGSVLYMPGRMPDEIVLKHTDGELNKIKRSVENKWSSERRDELEVNFWEDGLYSSPITAAATLADRQAFGFRLNGDPINPLGVSHSPGDAETVEIEGLDMGGVVIEDTKQLPFGVYTTDEMYYRVFNSEDPDSGEIPEPVAILERREGPGGKWEELARSEPAEAGYLVGEIADDSEIEAKSVNTGEISAIIDEQQDSFKASRTSEEEELRNQFAIQNKTAFPPTTPPPRPITFPD